MPFSTAVTGDTGAFRGLIVMVLPLRRCIAGWGDETRLRPPILTSSLTLLLPLRLMASASGGGSSTASGRSCSQLGEEQEVGTGGLAEGGEGLASCLGSGGGEAEALGGTTMKEFLEWRRRLAKALPWISSSAEWHSTAASKSLLSILAPLSGDTASLPHLFPVGERLGGLSGQPSPLLDLASNWLR